VRDRHVDLNGNLVEGRMAARVLSLPRAELPRPRLPAVEVQRGALVVPGVDLHKRELQPDGSVCWQHRRGAVDALDLDTAAEREVAAQKHAVVATARHRGSLRAAGQPDRLLGRRCPRDV